MLHEQVCRTNFAVEILLARHTVLTEVGCVILTHVVFESLTVCVQRRLPSRLFGRWVEIVR